MLLTWADQPGLIGEDDRLHPVAQREFGKDMPDMGLYGRFADSQPGRYLGVGPAPGQMDENLLLPVGELPRVAQT